MKPSTSHKPFKPAGVGQSLKNEAESCTAPDWFSASLLLIGSMFLGLMIGFVASVPLTTSAIEEAFQGEQARAICREVLAGPGEETTARSTGPARTPPTVNTGERSTVGTGGNDER